MKMYINYANANFLKSQKNAIKKALTVGGFDHAIAYNKKDIDEQFYKQNANVLDIEKGDGLWIWKAYFILKTLGELEYGDYLFYSDSGAFFTKNIDFIIDELDSLDKQDVFAFELPLIESQWTKKELFKKLKCDDDRFRRSNQIQAGFQLIRKTNASLNFYKELLDLMLIESNVCDDFLPEIQEPNFIEHRHDQSVFSLLYKKYSFKPLKDPTQFGSYPQLYFDIFIPFFRVGNIMPCNVHCINGVNYRMNQHQQSYDNVIFLHRRSSPLSSYVKYLLKRKLNYFGCAFGEVK